MQKENSYSEQLVIDVIADESEAKGDDSVTTFSSSDVGGNERRRIQKISEKWFLTEPLLFSVFCTHSLVSNDAMLNYMRTGKMRIEFNPFFTQNLSDYMLEELLKVEMLRILLKHPYQRQPPLANKAALYYASDVTISEHYETDAPIKKKEDFSLQGGLCFEEYYAKILPLIQRLDDNTDTEGGLSEKNNSENDEDDDNSHVDDGDTQSQGGENDSSDTDSNNATPEQLASEAAQLWEENDAAAETINAEIERAEQSNSWGTLGGNLVEIIRASLVVQMDYRKMLSRFRATMLSSKRRLTRMRPSRRYGFMYMGSRHDFTTKLLVAVDVSGSVSSKNLVHFFSIINRFFKYGIESIDVIQFDHEIKGKPVSIKKARRDVKIIGRGGTCFQGAIDFYEEHSDYDGLIMFTDGYAEIPETHRNGNNILWVFTSKSEYDAHTWVREMRGSRATFIPARR